MPPVDTDRLGSTFLDMALAWIGFHREICSGLRIHLISQIICPSTPLFTITCERMLWILTVLKRKSSCGSANIHRRLWENFPSKKANYTSEEFHNFKTSACVPDVEATSFQRLLSRHRYLSKRCQWFSMLCRKYMDKNIHKWDRFDEFMNEGRDRNQCDSFEGISIICEA